MPRAPHLRRGCCTRAWLAVGDLFLGLSFTCKSLCFASGAEGIRTPDLRRVKAKRRRRGRSPVFRYGSKSGDPLPRLVADVRRRSPGLASGLASTCKDYGLLAASTQLPELPPNDSYGKPVEIPDRAEELGSSLAHAHIYAVPQDVALVLDTRTAKRWLPCLLESG